MIFVVLKCFKRAPRKTVTTEIQREISKERKKTRQKQLRVTLFLIYIFYLKKYDKN